MYMSYYIKDKTVGKYVIKESLNELVKYAEDLCVRYYKQTRESYMNEMVSIGHGYDDPTGSNFIQLMSDEFETGVLNSSGKYVRTNVHEYDRNVRYRNEYGD